MDGEDSILFLAVHFIEFSCKCKVPQVGGYTAVEL